MFGKDLFKAVMEAFGEPRMKSTYRGPGRQRADARLAQKREANKTIPDIYGMTRQQRRHAERRAFKDHRAAVKRHVMQQKEPGGAAKVR